MSRREEILREMTDAKPKNLMFWLADRIVALEAELVDINVQLQSVRFALAEYAPPTDFELSYGIVRDTYDLKHRALSAEAEVERLNQAMHEIKLDCPMTRGEVEM